MKKIISAALAVILMLGTLFLASCGKDEPTTQAANGTQKTTASTAAPTEATVDPASATIAPTTAPTTAKATKKPTKKQSATKAKSTKKVSDKVPAGFKPPIGGKKPPVTVKKPTTTKKSTTSTTKKAVANTYYMGQVSDAGVYTNKFADMKLTLNPNDWGFLDKSELADYENTDTGVYKNDTTFKKYLDNNESVTDAYAYSYDGLMSVVFTFENLVVTESVGVTAADYIDYMVYIFTELGEDLYGITYTLIDSWDNITLSNHSYAAVELKAEIDGETIYQKQYIRMIGDYAYLITSVSATASGLNDIERAMN